MSLFDVVRGLRFAAVAFVVASGAGGAMAQESADATALRADQAELFREMLAAPDDVELMYRYALTSIRLKDYEAAITTLERILIYNPALPQVKLELGAAYYRIGSYPVAAAYFQDVLDDTAATPDQKARASEFTAEIERRVQTSYFVGKVGVGALFTTNANNGPDSPNIELGGVIVQLTDPKATSQTDIGGVISGNISHFYDLGMPTDDQWRTDFGFYSARFADTKSGAVDVVLLRTGPRLSIDDDRYGPKVRPYIEVDHVRYGNDPLYSTFGAGVEVTNTVNQQLSVFGDVRFGFRDDHTPIPSPTPGGAEVRDADGLNIRARAGFTYFLDDATILRGYGLFAYEGADTDPDRNYEFGVGGDATYRYASGFEFADRPWEVNAGARATYRRFDEIGIAGNGVSPREDLDLQVSLGHTAFVGDGFGLVAKASYFVRESNSVTFEVDNFSLFAGAEFRF